MFAGLLLSDWGGGLLLTELDKVLFYMGRREVPFESSFEKVPSGVKDKLIPCSVGLHSYLGTFVYQSAMLF